MNIDKIGMYKIDEILEFMTEGEGRGFLGRSMFDAMYFEIERLNNIINELEKYLKENIKLTKTAVHFEILDDYDTRKYKRDIALFEMVLDKLKELKDSD